MQRERNAPKERETFRFSTPFGRSANGEILYLIRQAIKDFENNEGEIEYQPSEESK